MSSLVLPGVSYEHWQADYSLAASPARKLGSRERLLGIPARPPPPDLGTALQGSTLLELLMSIEKEVEHTKGKLPSRKLKLR